MATVYWDLTSRCDGVCAYCSAGARGARRAPTRGGERADGTLASAASAEIGASANRPPGEIPPRLVPEVFRRLRAGGATGVVLLGGEPTLAPALQTALDAARREGLTVGIATNGLAHSERLRESWLGRAGLSVNFSIDSFFPRENDAVRGSGAHAKAWRNLGALLAARKSANGLPRVTVQMTLTRVNLARLGDSVRRIAESGVDAILLERMRVFPWHGDDVRALAPGPREWIDGAARLARAATRVWRGPGKEASHASEGSSGHPAIVLNYGNALLKAALAKELGFPGSVGRSCPGGFHSAVMNEAGGLHPCRLAAARLPPKKDDGSSWYEKQCLSILEPGGEGFLDSPYFTRFFRFAHSARVYERLALCRECPHYATCEPCPMDVMAGGDRVLSECREMLAGGIRWDAGPGNALSLP